MDSLLILSLALMIDLVVGEPPRAFHPVVWMGKAASLWEKRGTGKPATAQFVYGLVMTLVTVGLFSLPVYFLLETLENAHRLAYVALGAAIFKSAFSWRELRRAALNIKRLLTQKKLEEARLGLRALVKRDTGNLSEPLMVSATVESVAENAGDSFIAPLFYFLLFGVPGAVAYRVVNTLDAMIGYHGQYEYLGKFAARLDDALNLVPARLTGLLLVVAALLSGENGRVSWRIMLSDHARTASPNAGWAMAAMAGALNVQLEKVGHYQLGKADAPLLPQTIDAALRLAGVAALIWVIVCSVALYAIYW